MPTKTVEKAVIEIPAIDVRHMTLKIVGDTPLIMHAWDEKVKKEMLDKMMGKAKSKLRDLKDPVREFIHSMYWLDGAPEEATEEGFNKAIESGKARFGFKAVAFKESAVAAGYRGKIMKDKVATYGMFHIDGEFVEIHGTPRPNMREDMVRVANGAPDIRYRGEFPEWWAILSIKYNAGVISAEQLANLFNLGGFVCGLGEWRIEKGGQFGMYHVSDIG